MVVVPLFEKRPDRGGARRHGECQRCKRIDYLPWATEDGEFYCAWCHELDSLEYARSRGWLPPTSDLMRHFTQDSIKKVLENEVNVACEYGTDDECKRTFYGFDKASAIIHDAVRNYAVTQALNWNADIYRLRAALYSSIDIIEALQEKAVELDEMDRVRINKWSHDAQNALSPTPAAPE